MIANDALSKFRKPVLFTTLRAPFLADAEQGRPAADHAARRLGTTRPLAVWGLGVRWLSTMVSMVTLLLPRFLYHGYYRPLQRKMKQHFWENELSLGRLCQSLFLIPLFSRERPHC